MRRRPRHRITAIYARRDEPDHLVDELRRNLGWVDDILEHQVDRTGGWTHEGRKLAAMREAARRRGATWLLWTAPDERFQDGAEAVIRRAVATAHRGTLFRFPFHELWTPTDIRVDGIWPKEPRKLLWNLTWAGYRFADIPMHCAEWPTRGVRHRVLLDVHVYHLKNIDPANRVARARAYADADPANAYFHGLAPDWSYLYDDEGLDLVPIPAGRMYSPIYVPGSYVFTPPGLDLQTQKAPDSP